MIVRKSLVLKSLIILKKASRYEKINKLRKEAYYLNFLN